MLNQTISSIPQAPSAKSSTRSAEVRTEPSSAKSDGTTQPGEQATFGTVLARQLDENISIPSGSPFIATDNTQLVKAKDATSLQSDQTKKSAPDETSVVLTALFLANPEIRPTVGKSVNIEAENAVKTGKDLAPSLIEQAGKSEKPLSALVTPGKLAASNAKATQPDQAILQKTVLAESNNIDVPASRLTNTAPSALIPDASASAMQALGQQSNALPNIVPNNQVTISAPLGSNAWPQEFSQKITWISTQQMQSAELHLNPPDLGPVHIILHVSENKATALFSSPHSAVRDAMENALPKLREILADNGIMLGNATVSDQTPRDSGGFTEHSPRTGTTLPGIASTELKANAAPSMASRRHEGMVDTFA